MAPPVGAYAAWSRITLGVWESLVRIQSPQPSIAWKSIRGIDFAIDPVELSPTSALSARFALAAVGDPARRRPGRSPQDVAAGEDRPHPAGQAEADEVDAAEADADGGEDEADQSDDEKDAAGSHLVFPLRRSVARMARATGCKRLDRQTVAILAPKIPTPPGRGPGSTA